MEENKTFVITAIFVLFTAIFFSSYGSELTGHALQIIGPQTTLLRSCGNGVIQFSETCDDGNKINGDGCSLSCKIENGWICSGQPSVCTFFITIGEKNLLAVDDSGNGNLMVAQQTSLPQSATIQSLSFYVSQASGKLRMGIYDATGPSGGPGAKKAETNEITPVVGWNTANVVTPVSLAPGNYWLAYLPSSSNLHFKMEPTGNAKWYTYTYGVMPATFSTAPLGGAYHWSFYATLNAGGSPPVFDFSLSNAGDKIVVNGSSVTNAITATLVSGIPQSVFYSLLGLPSGVTGTFSPTSCSPLCSTTLTLSAAASVSPSTSSILVTGTAGSVSHTTSFFLTVNQQSSCGNGIITGTETCDDANTNSGDGCSSTCTIETGWTCSGQPSVCEQSEGGVRVGINIAAVVDFSSELVFVDVMKQARPWSPPDGAWPASKLDVNGWPIPPFTTANPYTLIFWDIGGNYPSGDYTLMFEGQGTINIWGGTPNKDYTHNGVGTATFKVPVQALADELGLYLTIKSSTPGNHVRNISLIMPGHETTYQTQPFNPKFLQDLEGFKVIRLMDFFNTNGNPIINWTDRKLPTQFPQSSYAQSQKGVAMEYGIDLANALGVDVWINVPYQANDDYVQNMAQFIKDRLNPSSKIYLEYSNEVWNTIFDSQKYAQAQGTALGFEAPGLYGNSQKWYSYRFFQVFKIFRDVFGSQSDRVINTINAQSAVPWWAEQFFSYETTPIIKTNGQPFDLNPTDEEIEALAIAPYISGEALNLGPGANVTQVLTLLEADIANVKNNQVIPHKAIATQHGAQLINYEGGQHLFNNPNVPGGSPLEAFMAANRHPQMKAIYTEYLNMLFDNGVELFTHFNSVYWFEQNGGKYGLWGLKEFQDQQPCVDAPPNNYIAPKWQAVREFMGYDPCV